MIFKYPLQSITTKDIDRLMYRTIDALGINMNKYNHNSSNTFYLLDIAAMELERAKFDLQYQFNPSMSNINFTTIDRINRFAISSIQNIKQDTRTGIVYSDEILSGYCINTDKSYQLKNTNKFTDLIRHSLPVDVFLEAQEETFNINDFLPQTITLTPNIKYSYSPSKKIKNTKITILLETSDIKDILIFPAPVIRIGGYDKDFSFVEEGIILNTPLGTVTETEFSRIEYILLTGTTDSLTIKMYPMIKSLYSSLLYDYVDRDEQYTFSTIYSVDKENNKLLINRIDPTFTMPPTLDKYEEFLLDIDNGRMILDYYLDEPNHLLYTITYDLNQDKKLEVFPIYIPEKRDNISKLINSESQNVKISYSRDTILRQYVLTLYPASIMHGVDSVSISIKHFSKEEKGNWSPSTQYNIGDLFYYAGEYFISTVNHISGQYFDIDKVIPQVEYITQDLILELILHGIESNSIEISFDKLFKLNNEAIIQVETTGIENCITQILAQYNKVEKIISVNFPDLFSFKNLSPSGNIMPIANQENVLMTNKLNSYNVKSFTQDITGINFIIYSKSSSNKLYINGYPFVNVFNSFYLDWPTKTLITSDTISQIVRQ